MGDNFTDDELKALGKQGERILAKLRANRQKAGKKLTQAQYQAVLDWLNDDLGKAASKALAGLDRFFDEHSRQRKSLEAWAIENGAIAKAKEPTAPAA